jgi:putative molybdopterin biosynthesis protein
MTRKSRFGRRYLRRRSLDEAREIFFTAAIDTEAARRLAETVPTAEALGRVTAATVAARHPAPFYHSSAMDGLAVAAEQTFGASEQNPVSFTVPGEALWVDTGDPIPEGRDAVVVSEEIHYREEGKAEIFRPLAPGDNVRVTGQEIATGEMILPSSWEVGPADVGALLAAGVTEVAVKSRPVVAILPTGSEMIRPGDPLVRGKVVEFNSEIVAALVRGEGGEPRIEPPLPDDREKLTAAIGEASETADVVVVLAGSSAGTEDFTPGAIGEKGELLVHGVNIAPGKPTALGLVGGRPVIGLPGYPVAMALSARLFLQPLLRRLLGLADPVPETTRAVLPKAIPSRLDSREFIRVRLGKVGRTTYAYPLPRGSAVILSYSRAQGLVSVPEGIEGVPADEEVEVELLRGLPDLERTVVLSGSHDLLLDILEDEMRQQGFTLIASAVGSLGGLFSLRDGTAHLATSHLLDAESGEYNTPFVERFLSGREVRRVSAVFREQGLMVLPGNPKDVSGWKDLGRPDVSFVNRQKGSGSRVLLDVRLAGAGVAPGEVRGYGREEYTHWAVAMAVQSGLADTGLGIRSAATTMGLDFVPLEEEEFDFLIPGEHLANPGIEALQAILSSEGFRRRVVELGGYRFR